MKRIYNKFILWLGRKLFCDSAIKDTTATYPSEIASLIDRVDRLEYDMEELTRLSSTVGEYHAQVLEMATTLHERMAALQALIGESRVSETGDPNSIRSGIRSGLSITGVQSGRIRLSDSYQLTAARRDDLAPQQAIQGQQAMTSSGYTGNSSAQAPYIAPLLFITPNASGVDNRTSETSTVTESRPDHIGDRNLYVTNSPNAEAASRFVESIHSMLAEPGSNYVNQDPDIRIPSPPSPTFRTDDDGHRELDSSL